MAAPSYTTDLTTINDCSSTSTPDTWAEPTAMTAGTTIAAQTDFYIEGAACISKLTNQTGTSGAGFVDASGATTLPAGEAFWFWIYHIGAKALDTRANGGLQVIVGSSLANYYAYYLEGKDTYVVGGWKRVPIDPTLTGNDADGFAFRNRTSGTPSGSWVAYGGGAVQLSAVAGASLGIDYVAYGRDLTVEFGDLANGYGTFAGVASADSTSSWGLMQFINGAYYTQGLLILGTTTNAVDFRDTGGAAVFIQKTPKVASGFNEIEIRNASSRVDWGAISFTALGNQSRGKLTITDNADVNISGCSFTGMDTFSLQAGTDILDSSFRGCNAITAPGSNLSGTSVLVPTVAADASALVWNVTTDTDGKLDNMTFSKGTNAHHAIQFGAAADPGSNTLRGITFSGFNAANGSNDSALYFSDTGADVTWTVNLIGCSGTISYKKVRSGDTVSLVSNPVTLSIHVQDIDTAAAIVGARVYIPVTSTASGRPYNQTINSITRSGSTATVTFAANHNLATNDYLKISGCDQPEYNQAFQVTVTGTTTLTVTVSGTPASGSGTMVGTWIIINNVTDGSGNISASYTYAASQTISGWVRLAPEGGPYYKTAPISGTVSSTTGLSATVQLIPDS